MKRNLVIFVIILILFILIALIGYMIYYLQTRMAVGGNTSSVTDTSIDVKTDRQRLSDRAAKQQSTKRLVYKDGVFGTIKTDRTL
ncbi:hypothetical protein P154DRAFT_582310 [Amniculicola lignicola CBS 123094]|uniref:Uncharacterized protein n=1 Tax=Amniculicola lignicola CBS 123094 TaxID=1392246 RepID=A0A6A5VYW5_9PLEO|nr:hypothetical protein P154DRAFT_582310 [Amniculicola lignicola CBS 123094]